MSTLMSSRQSRFVKPSKSFRLAVMVVLRQAVKVVLSQAVKVVLSQAVKVVLSQAVKIVVQGAKFFRDDNG